MQMAEEEVPDVRPAGDDAGEVLRALERDLVHPLQLHREGRMMLEEVDRPVGRGVERALEPGEALFAQHAPGDPRLVGVGADEEAGLRLQRVLDEAVLVPWCHGERRLEVGPVVMVAEQQVIGQAQFGQALPQHAVGRRLAAVAEVAREDRERRVTMVAVDVGDAEPQPFGRVEFVEPLAGGTRWVSVTWMNFIGDGVRRVGHGRRAQGPLRKV